MKLKHFNRMKETKKHITGFKVPQDYFKQKQAELIAIAKLEHLPKQSGFKVPNSYFENFEENLLDSITKKKEPKVIPMITSKIIMYTTTLAACGILGFFLFFNNKTISLSEISDTEIETYMLEGNLNIETQEIAKLLDEEEIESLYFTTELSTEKNLEDYLFENINNTNLINLHY